MGQGMTEVWGTAEMSQASRGLNLGLCAKPGRDREGQSGARARDECCLMSRGRNGLCSQGRLTPGSPQGCERH